MIVKIVILVSYRVIKNMKDTIGNFHREDNFQENLVALTEERDPAPAAPNGQIRKRTLKQIIRANS